MTYHVRVGEVHYDEVILIFLDVLHELVLNLRSRHLWLQVVCSHLRTCHKHTLLILVWSLTTTIEEECNMRILLSLSSMELL